ncbi:hypothetical protein GIB67_037893 [Kingdonia uniflora]|uniref:Uncharacterized protein n=1 Tax=Kingdonia uniflora TaxID=39325 RepID=A0A7J7LH07_9MAGN|nr:hypothetical protein GIB67_037893 [Kingdonia uniflora]
MSLEEGEYDGTSDEEGSESDYSKGHVSQLRFLLGKKQKNDFEEARVGFKCRSVLVKLHEIYLILIEYYCYEYCQIDHHILIDNRLDNFWPRMSAWQTKRRKVTGNRVKHHLALMRQQLDLRTINNMQWDPFKNIKDTLKREVQLEHRAVPYDPPEKLHCIPSSDLARSLRAAGWIETQHYIVGHHVDYDAYWRNASLGALMSNIVRCGNIDIPGLGALTSGVTFPHVEFPTTYFSTQETQISPPRLGYDFFAMTEGMWKPTLDRTLDLKAQHLHDESRITHLTVDLILTEGRLSQLNDYLEGEEIVVDWEDDEGEAGIS